MQPRSRHEPGLKSDRRYTNNSKESVDPDEHDIVLGRHK